MNINLNMKSKKLNFFILITVIILMNVIIFKNFIFNNSRYLYMDIGSDTITSYYPYYLNFLRTVKNGDLSFWSHSFGMGNNILSMESLFTDPFAVLLLLFGETYLPQGLLLMAIVKITCAGAAFYLYEGNFSISDNTKILGALLYAFNGYIILWGQHYHLATIVVLLPLLVHGYEMMLKKEKGIVMTAAIALIAIYSVYYLYMVSIFLFLYAIVRYVDYGKKNIKAFGIHLLKSILSYVMGLGLGGIIMFPAVWLMLSSPRVGIHASQFPLFKLNTLLYYVTTVLRVFANNAMGIGDYYFGYFNFYEAPMLYSGMLTLLMIPFFFKGIEKRRAVIYGTMLVAFVLFLVLPHFSAMFNAYSVVAYRWTFMVNFLMIAAAVHGLENCKKNYSAKTLIYTAFCVIGVIAVALIITHYFLPVSKAQIKIIAKYMIPPIAFMLAYIIVLNLSNSEKHKPYMTLMLTGLVILELVTASYFTVFRHRGVVKSSYFQEGSGYNDYTYDALSYIKEQDKGFYRIDKNYCTQSLNDNLVQNYNGIKAYNSINHSSIIEFMNKMGVPFKIHVNFITDFNDRHSLEDVAGIKYYLVRGVSKQPKEGYTFLKKFNDITIYKNEDYLPLGFTYDKYIKASDFQKLPIDKKDITILKALVVEDSEENLKINELDKQVIQEKDHSGDISERKRDSFNINKFKNGYISGNIEINDKNKTLFISIPYDKGWKAKVNGKTEKIIKGNFGFMALNIEKGNNSIELEYKQPLLKEGITASIVSLILLVLLRWKKFM